MCVGESNSCPGSRPPAQLLQLQLRHISQQLVPARLHCFFLGLQLLQPVLRQILRHQQLHLIREQLLAVITAAAAAAAGGAVGRG
jgi:hypothetical protein